MKKTSLLRSSYLCVFIMLSFMLPNQIVFASDEYLARDPYYSMNDPNVNRATSEHFQIIWGNNDETGLVNNAFIQGNLRNLENMWKLFIDDMGMVEPSQSIHARNRDGRKYKTNVYVTRTGLSQHLEGWAFMSGDRQGFGYMIMDPRAMRVDPPSWVVPHEFGHVLTMHLESWVNNDVTGPWWESVANWFKEQYLYSDYYEFNGRRHGPDTDFFEPLYKSLNLFMAHGRNYYQSWPILQYVTENPENYPHYGKGFVKRIQQEALREEHPIVTIDRLSPGVCIKDTLGHYAKRMATQDFVHKNLYQRRFNQMIGVDHNRQIVLTQLVKVSDKDGWWKVPIERAPQQTGMNIIPLVPNGSGNGRVLSVNFNGLVDESRGSDWRSCIVIVNDSTGNTRYSSLWNSGVNSVTLSSNENTAYLVVIATPDTILPVTAFQDERAAPYQTSPSKAKFPYEVQITGGVPYEERPNTSGLSGRRHSNGGGFVQSTATVASTAYVGPDAVVLGRARVSDNARIEDFAVVKDNAVVSGNAVISGHALVKDRAVVRENAKVRDFAVMLENSQASGNSRVLESAVLSGDYTITDNGVAKGTVDARGRGSVSGQGMIDGDYSDTTNVNAGTAFGWNRGQEYASNIPYTNGLYAGYEFISRSSLYALDKHGVTHGILRGSPTWRSSLENRQGVIQLNGVNQYIVLEKSVSDLKEMEIHTSVRWDGGEPNQKLFTFGASEEKSMYLTPSDENGKAKFVIRDGNTIRTLTGNSAFPVNRWTDIRVVLANGAAILYVDNNIWAANYNVPIKPEDLNPPNVNYESACNYIGRGANSSDPLFKGSIDYFNIYFRAGEIPTEPVLPEQIAHYKFDESTGTTAKDWTDKNKNAVLRNGANFTRGISGNSVQLNGVNQYIELPDGILEGVSDFTIATWVKLDTINTWQRIFDFGNNTDVNMFLTPSSGGNDIRFAIKNGGTEQRINAPLNLQTGTWIHIAVTLSNRTGIIYVDGKEVSRNSNITITPKDLGATSNNYIGRSQYQDPYLNGQIDDFRIYNYALGSEEIDALSRINVPTFILGDVNGDNSVNSTDVNLMRRFILGIIDDFPYAEGKLAADVNGDGLINSTDYTLLRRYVLGIISTF
ncbi:UNVERIFIED_CONTAM: UDP-3-O-[3-hydroxymyristoyl] glucosamine N-acyltransferase [Acetivibrio alkalicellulosi]